MTEGCFLGLHFVSINGFRFGRPKKSCPEASILFRRVSGVSNKKKARSVIRIFVRGKDQANTYTQERTIKKLKPATKSAEKIG